MAAHLKRLAAVLMLTGILLVSAQVVAAVLSSLTNPLDRGLTGLWIGVLVIVTGIFAFLDRLDRMRVASAISIAGGLLVALVHAFSLGVDSRFPRPETSSSKQIVYLAAYVVLTALGLWVVALNCAVLIRMKRAADLPVKSICREELIAPRPGSSPPSLFPLLQQRA